MRISQILVGYWLAKRRELSRHTYSDYTLTFRRFTEFMRDCEFASVTSTDVQRFLNWLCEEFELSDKTLCNAWIALSSLWTWAEIELEMAHVIRNRVSRPRFADNIPDPFTQEEIKVLVKAATHTAEWSGRAGGLARSRRATAERERAIILVLVDTGLRAQELCDLTIADYDQDRQRLHVRHGKHDRGRFVVLGDRACRALWRYLASREKTRPTDPLFATKTNEHLERNNLRRTLQIIGENAGVPNVYCHRFRHTFAIQFLRNGGNVIVLRELLGHRSLEMVMRYARVAETDIAAAARHSPADHWRV
jgi:integrase/recombinase XerD